MKFQRTYKLEVQGINDTHTIEFPLTLDFDIQRNTLASLNTGKFTIYNLKESVRADIFHDRFDTLNIKQVKLAAGYISDPALPIIFQGQITNAYSYRSGTNWLTEIECFDGMGTLNSDISISVPAGWNFKSIIHTLSGAIQGASAGAIGEGVTPNSRGLSISGNPWEAIQKLNPYGNNFIDKGLVNVISRNEYIDSNDGINVISSRGGMLGTPRRHNTIIEVPIIFEPRAVVGQIVFLDSLERVNNGDYQIIGIHHKAIISGAVTGNAITDLSLSLGTRRLTPVTIGNIVL